MTHFVYETTNLLNGKKYIGKHSTCNMDDGYLGSGKHLCNSIKKYGKENFERKILKEFNDEKKAYQYEERLVTKEIVDDRNYYNITTGGNGLSSEDVKKQWENPEHKKLMSANMKRLRKDPEFNQKNAEICSKRLKKLWKDLEFRDMMSKTNSKRLKKLWKDLEYRDMMSKGMKERSTGENNSNSKLTEENVKDIKKRLQQGERGVDIAKIYNVKRCTISSIKNGRNWKHI